MGKKISRRPALIYFYRNFKIHERNCNISTWKWGEALMETDGANLPPNHSLLGNTTPGTKYVLLGKLD